MSQGEILQKPFEFLVRQTGVLYDCFERVRIETLVIRNRYAMNPIGHAYMLAARYDLKPCFHQCPDGALRRDIGKKHFRREPLPDKPWSFLFPPLSSEGRS